MKMDLGEDESGEIVGGQHTHQPHYVNFGKHDSNGGGRSNGVRGNSSNGGGGNDGAERRMVDITRDKPIKVSVRVQVPVRDHPKFNFVGKLLGPKGNSLKRLQEDTMCKMAVLGRGSMKDRQKEEELRISGDSKFSHLMDDLHVEISAYATPAEAHARIAYALAEVRRFLVPDYNDDIRQEQMWEMQILNTQGREGVQAVEAPLSPASSLEAAGSPTAATTANSIDGHEDNPRPTPSPPHPAALKTQGTVLPMSSTLGGRKRPLLPGARPTMSPTKRTVMSFLARARAAQNKEPLQPPVSLVGPNHQAATAPMIQAALQMPTTAMQPGGTQLPQSGATQVSQLQLAAAQSIPQHNTVTQRQPLIQSHTQHPVLAPTIHGLLHAHFRRAAAGATVIPILREDFMTGVNQHQVQNVHIA